MLLEPAGHFAVRAAVGKHPNRGPGSIAIRRSVGVNRDKEIGVLLTCDVRTPHDGNEIIAVARQHGPELRIGIQQRAELTRNRYGHILLFRAVRTNGSRILAAVAGVNGDNHFIVAGNGTRRRTRYATGAGHRGEPVVIGFKRVARGFARTHGLRHGPFRLSNHHRLGWRRRRRVGVNRKHHGVVRAVLLFHRAGFAVGGEIHQQAQRLRILRRPGTNAFYQIIAAKLQR